MLKSDLCGGGEQFYDNQVVVWDKILTDKADGNVTLTNKKIKYSLRDHGHGASAMTMRT